MNHGLGARSEPGLRQQLLPLLVKHRGHRTHTEGCKHGTERGWEEHNETNGSSESEKR